MTIAITQDEGSATAGGGTIQDITGGVLNTSTSLTTPALGDIVTITGSSTAANNSFFSITELAVGGDATMVRLSPAPTDQGASGTARRLNRATVLQTSTAVTSFATLGTGGEAVNFLRADGAAFITNGVRRGDRVIIAGGGVNQGIGCYAREALSEDVIAVDTVGGVAWSTTAVTTETVVVRQGQHRITTLDETDVDWAEFISAGTLTNGAGVAGRPTCLRRRTIVSSTGGQERFSVELFGISRVVLSQSSGSTSTSWLSNDEVVTPMKLPVGGTGVVNYRIDAPSPSGVSVIVIGTNPNGDRHSAATGSAWTGIVLFATDLARLQMHRYGSYWDPGDAVIDSPGSGADLIATIVKCRFDGSASMRIESAIISSKTSAASVPAAALTDAQNVLLASSALAGASIASGSIEGLLISDSIILPLFQLLGATVSVDNPREDYAIEDLFSGVSGAGATGNKRYLFNPRFVKRSPTGSSADPIEDLNVEVYSVNEDDDSETLEFSGQTDVNGRLNAGAGVLFTRADSIGSPSTYTQYTTRTIVRGYGYRTLNQKRQLRALFDADVGVDLLADNLENEVGAL